MIKFSKLYRPVIAIVLVILGIWNFVSGMSNHETFDIAVACFDMIMASMIYFNWIRDIDKEEK